MAAEGVRESGPTDEPDLLQAVMVRDVGTVPHEVRVEFVRYDHGGHSRTHY